MCSRNSCTHDLENALHMKPDLHFPCVAGFGHTRALGHTGLLIWGTRLKCGSTRICPDPHFSLRTYGSLDLGNAPQMREHTYLPRSTFPERTYGCLTLGNAPQPREHTYMSRSTFSVGDSVLTDASSRAYVSLDYEVPRVSRYMSIPY